jgi:hypothetical protein
MTAWPKLLFRFVNQIVIIRALAFSVSLAFGRTGAEARYMARILM